LARERVVEARGVRLDLGLPQQEGGDEIVHHGHGVSVHGRDRHADPRGPGGGGWEQLIQEELFTPLGMASCGFGAPGSAGALDQPWGHDVTTPVSPGPLADNPPSLGPAGTVHCSLVDWGKFLAVHLHGARNETVPLVSQATLTELQTPPAGGDYACGWGVVDRPWAGGTALTHTGSNTYWLATAWLAPAKNTTLAVVTNRGDDVAANAVDASFAPLTTTYLP
jgi:D-alanyl-D-alanine carboxypeptidase